MKRFEKSKGADSEIFDSPNCLLVWAQLPLQPDFLGALLSSSTVAADEVGGGATAHYTYVEEQELTEQEKV